MRDWLSHRAVVSPDATALITADSSTSTDMRAETETTNTRASVTYSALNETVDQVAARLATLGVGHGSHVGLLMSNRPEAVWLIHATMRLGAVVVPLSTEQTLSELAPRVERADLDLLVCERETEPIAVDCSVPVSSVDDGNVSLMDSPAADESAADPEWKPTDPLVMLYTSGTTGQPKLVVLTVRNVFTSAVASADRLGVLPTDRWCSPLALHHMGGIAPVYRAVIDGTGLILAPTDPKPLLNALSQHEATGVSIVPVLLERLLSVGTLPDSLRVVLLGGAPASNELIEHCGDRGVPLHPTYGMTEAASQIATARPSEATANPGTVGRPLFMTTVTIIDDDGYPLPPNERGEIVVSGPTIMKQYYRDSKATGDAFCAHGFRTGDIGYLDEDDRLWVDGRAGDRIVTGGKTVDPSEVANVLCDHPEIADAAVVGLPDAEWGECVGALLEQTDQDSSVDAATIESYCRARLASHKLPRVVTFGAIPRTESGTIDREVVRARLDVART
ncbi:class I adenylate-forming enzyme family protein [Halocatena marina]|uniref:Class I adenylate-forming enzyme family protein n=1 Tax=Halocatena marina TaxID=2934937 RepID=A0ABD5YL91_9EURY|nr:AMP-binding protein [Halocatena marina]